MEGRVFVNFFSNPIGKFELVRDASITMLEYGSCPRLYSSFLRAEFENRKFAIGKNKEQYKYNECNKRRIAEWIIPFRDMETTFSVTQENE